MDLVEEELKEEEQTLDNNLLNDDPDYEEPDYVPEPKKSFRERKAERRYQKKLLTNYNLKNDIRYRGPFGVLSIRIMAWVCLIFTQLVIVLDLAQMAMPNDAFPVLSEVLSILSDLSLPCFLLGSFTYIIQRKGASKDLIVTYALLMIGVVALFYTFSLHYGSNLVLKFMGMDFGTSTEMFSSFMVGVFGYDLKFNIFVDLFLCSLLVYFVLGTPKKVFTGKKIVWFRLMALIPILWEITAIILKILALNGKVELSIFMFPWLPTKYPMIFLAFISIVLFEKKRKMKYFKQGGTDESYEEYFMTRKNSLLFAKTAAKCFFFAGMTDLILAVALSIANTLSPNPMIVAFLEGLDIGQSVPLMLLAPFILLFSYNRIHKPSKLDIIIPIVAIILMGLVWVEAGYQFIMNAF